MSYRNKGNKLGATGRKVIVILFWSLDFRFLSDHMALNSVWRGASTAAALFMACEPWPGTELTPRNVLFALRFTHLCNQSGAAQKQKTGLLGNDKVQLWEERVLELRLWWRGKGLSKGWPLMSIKNIDLSPSKQALKGTPADWGRTPWPHGGETSEPSFPSADGADTRTWLWNWRNFCGRGSCDRAEISPALWGGSMMSPQEGRMDGWKPPTHNALWEIEVSVALANELPDYSRSPLACAHTHTHICFLTDWA